MAGRLSRGEIRLIRFRSPDKTRPALILTRESALAYLTLVTVVPITSTIRGLPTEVVLGIDDGMKQPCAINCDHVVTLRRSLVGQRVATLGHDRLRQVCSALAFALGCD